MKVALVLLLGLAALAALAEIAARAWMRRRGEYWVWTPHRRIRMEVCRETLPSLEPVVRFEVNRDGERGDEPPRDWRRAARILVAGGSAGECYLLDQASSWPAVVQSILNEPAPLARLGVERVHVGNVSRSLVPCECIHEILSKILPRYERLDALLLMVGASDVVNWLEKRAPAEIARGRYTAADVFAEHPEGPFGWSPKRLALRRLAARLHQRFARPLEVREKAGKTLAKNRRMRAEAEELIDEVPDPAPMLEAFGHWFRRILRLAKGRGARVVVVRQPWFAKEFTPAENALMWNFGAGRPYVEHVKAYYTHRVARELMGSLDALAERIAREEGVEQVDLMATLPRDLETYYDFFHFTPKGARQVGRAVAEALLDGRSP